MERNRFREVLAAVTLVTAGGFVAPSAWAALAGPSRAAVPIAASPSLTAPRQEPGDDEGDCLYPPSNRPKLTLFDPNKEYKRRDDVDFKGTARIQDCGIRDLTVSLYRSSSGDPRGAWTRISTTTTSAKGKFRMPQVRVTTTTFFRVTSDAGGGFVSADSNIVKIKIKN